MLYVKTVQQMIPAIVQKIHGTLGSPFNLQMERLIVYFIGSKCNFMYDYNPLLISPFVDKKVE